MPIENIDLDEEVETGKDSTGSSTNVIKDSEKENLNGSAVANVTKEIKEQVEQKEDKDNSENNNNENNSNSDNNKSNTSSTGVLSQGDEVEYEGVTYVLDEKGNLVNKENGELFKEAKDVEAFINGSDVVDTTSDVLSIDTIKNAIGIDIVDENGKSVDYTNDQKGIKAYFDAALDLKSSEIEKSAINKLYADNPLMKQFVDYVQVNGTHRGFGDIPDRSNIVLDPHNENQLEAVIRMAATEFGNKSLNDNYIKYLKDSGNLYDEAKEQLLALIGKDNAYRADLERKAEEQRKQEEQNLANYYAQVRNTIESGIIGKYKLPEHFVKEVNGKKYNLNRNDFYRYVAEPTVKDENGNKITEYQKDLSNVSDKDAMNNELLQAWLTFTKGNFEDLVDMAIKEKEVKRLIIKSKEQKTNSSLKINRANSSNSDKLSDILLDY